MLIPFEKKYRERYYKLLDEVFDSGFLSDGSMLKRFELGFSKFTGLTSCAVSNGGTALLAILEYLEVAEKEVIVPANTFWATAQAARKAGAMVVYADCNRNDLCLSVSDVEHKITAETKAVIVTHIGGHLAFEIDKLVELCKAHNIFLVEDCAHAHGGSWQGVCGGSFGIAGAYSFYATKTMPLGEGGMVVSRDPKFIEWLKKHRNYGKEVINGKVTYPLRKGFNYRLNEVSAALGIIQLERMPMILNWKRRLAAKFDQIFSRRINLPEGMISGYYKYIVFNYPELQELTGQVFGPDDLGPAIEGVAADIPASQWVSENHQCPPIWYGWDGAELEPEELRKRLGIKD